MPLPGELAGSGDVTILTSSARSFGKRSEMLQATGTNLFFDALFKVVSNASPGIAHSENNPSHER